MTAIDDAALDVSILFATRDRADQLRETLAAYKALDTQGLTWELIVVNNDSSDATSVILQQAKQTLPLTVLHVTAGGQNRARNHAVDRVRGALVVFTDDDVIPEPDCIKAYHAAAARWPDDAIFGARITPRFPPDTPPWLTRPDFTFSSTAFARYAPRDDEGPVKTHPYGPSFALRRAGVIGRRFPEHLGPQAGSYAMGGEAAYLGSLAREGYRYIYVPAAQVWHVVRPEQTDASWLFRRARNKGRGQVYLPSDKKPRRLYVRGVPLKLLLAVGRAWLRTNLARWFAPHERYIDAGITYELRFGQLLERYKHRGQVP